MQTYAITLENLSSIITNFPPLYAKKEIKLIFPSTFAKENLYYLILGQTIYAQFPFFLECSSFDAYLILYTIEGQGKLLYNTEFYSLKPNSVAFIDCHKSFRLDLDQSSNWKFKLFIINGSSTHCYYETYTQDHYCLCQLTPVSNLPSITHKLIECGYHHTNQTSFITSKLITDLLTELILAKNADLSHTVNLPKYLLQIKALFDLHYKEHFNLDELATTYHVSKYKIIRDFSTYLNNSPINYLIERRISAAKHLLLETDYPIYEIASLVGIDNINHFTNLFKKITHLTPNAYRKTGQVELNEEVSINVPSS